MGTRASKEAEGVTELTARKKQRKLRKISDCSATRNNRIHPELSDTDREMGSHKDLSVQASGRPGPMSPSPKPHSGLVHSGH